jgi:CHASE1-domain containing sensor protein
MKNTRILFIVLLLLTLTFFMTVKVLEKLEESNFNFRTILKNLQDKLQKKLLFS